MPSEPSEHIMFQCNKNLRRGGYDAQDKFLVLTMDDPTTEQRDILDEFEGEHDNWLIAKDGDTWAWALFEDTEAFVRESLTEIIGTSEHTIFVDDNPYFCGSEEEDSDDE